MNIHKMGEALIAIEIKLYNLTFGVLFPLEKEKKADSVDFFEAVDEIRVLKKKENRLINDILKQDVLEFSISSKDSLKEKLVNERVANLIFNNPYSDEYYYDYDDFEEDYDYVMDETVANDMSIDFLKNYVDDDCLEYKYFEGFTNPNLEDQLLLVGYDANNFPDISLENEEEVDALDNDVILDEIYYEYASDLISDLVNIDDGTDVEFLEYKFSKFGYVINLLNIDDVIILKDVCNYMANEGNVMASALLQIFDVVLGDVDEDKLNVSAEEGKYVDPEVYQQIKKLVDLENIIYKECLRIKESEKLKKGNSSTILNILVEEEKKLVNFINSKGFDLDDFKYCLDSAFFDLIIMDEAVEAKMVDVICARLESLIDVFNDNNNYMFKSNDVVKTINGQYQTGCLIDLERLIDSDDAYDDLERLIDSDDAYDDLVDIKYSIMYEESILMDNMIKADFDANLLFEVDDELIAECLELDLDEYYYDKNLILNTHVLNAINSLLNDKMSDANRQFRLIQVSRALKSLKIGNVDYLEKKCLDSGSFKKIPELGDMFKKAKVKTIKRH